MKIIFKACYFLIATSLPIKVNSQTLETAVQRGHTRAVKSVDFSHNGKFIISPAGASMLLVLMILKSFKFSNLNKAV